MSTPRSLRVPVFRALWFAGLISDAGDWLLFIALPVVVYGFTGSAFATAVAFLIELAPGVVLAPVAAWCGDRWDRRRLLVLLSIAQATALLPLFAVHDADDLPLLYVVILAEAALLAVFDPVKNAVLPALVPGEDLVSANSLIGLGQNLARLIGGPLGGALLAVGGLTLVAVADLVSYVAAAALLSTLGVGTNGIASAIPVARRRRFAACRTLLANASVRDTLVVTFLTQVAQGIFVVLFVLFVVQRLGGGAAEVGLLRGVQAAGAIAGAAVLTAVSRRLSAHRLTAYSTIVFGAVDLVLWNTSSISTATALYVALFVLVGVPGVLLGTGLISSLQTDVQAHEHVRTFAAFGVAANVGQAVGMLAAGVLTAGLGLMTVLNVQALIYLAAGGFAAWRVAVSRREAVRAT